MKKILAITALVSVIGLTGFYSASGNWGAGGMGGPGGCGGGGHHLMAGMDDATKTKFKAFLKETQDTRRAMAVKRAEKIALMNGDNPDAVKLGEIAGQLFDLHSTMQTKAEAAGLDGVFGRGPGSGNFDGSSAHHGRKGMKKGPGMKGYPSPSENQ